MPTVLVIHDRPDGLARVLERRFPDLTVAYATTPEEVPTRLRDYQPEAVLSLSHSRFQGRHHRPAIEHPSVRWVHVGGSGYEHFLPWNAERVTVTNSAGVLSRFLAETATGAMIALNGGFLRYIDQQSRSEWQPRSFRPLLGQTLLVVGLGHIGGWVAHNAKALGMHVLATRRTRTAHESVDELFTPDRLPDIVGRADVVSLHLRLDDSTRHLLNAPLLAAMKPGALLLNTARGGVVDEAALVGALQNRHLGGAYLDVFETEPLPAASPLWQMPNVLVTPHASDSVADWPNRFTALFADNLQRWLDKEPLLNVVRP